MADPKTILIVQIGKIGDMILTTPLFSELKILFPNTVLTVLSSEINKEIAQNNPYADKVIVYRKNIFRDLHLYLSSLRNQDIWIDTKKNYSRTSEILVKILKPRLSLGYNNDKKIFDIDLGNYQTGNHATEINISPVNYFTENKYLPKIKPEFDIPEIVKLKFDTLINRSIEYKNIVINVSAGDKSRYIKKEEWVKVINYIHEEGKYFIYITGLEKDMEMIDYILRTKKNSRVCFVSTESIIESAEIIRRSYLTITPDTSVVHLCSAFNIPVIAMYPDVKWNLDKFFPLSENAEVIVSINSEGISDISSLEINKSFDRLINKLK